MKPRNSALRAIGAVVVIVALLGVGWFFARDTEWWNDLTETTADESTSDADPGLSTTRPARSNVTDVETLDGVLRYQDRVQFVHRVDVVVTTVVEEVETPAAAPAQPGARGAIPVAETVIETITTTIEEAGERVVTGLPEPGQTIAPGAVLYETDSTPVFLIEGEVAAWRTMESGLAGPDIAQLNAFLVAGGWALDTLEGDEWLAATTTAVSQWQSDTGQTSTGTVELGDLWFVAGPIRITEVLATEGLVVADGEPLFAYTSQRRSIEVTVDALPEGLVDADDIEARLPDGTVVPAQIESIRGNDTGFDIVLAVDLSGANVPVVNGLRTSMSWTVGELVDALTLPPEALRRTDSGVYVADVVEGDEIRTIEVDVVGQAGRVVAIEGVDEFAEVVIP